MGGGFGHPPRPTTHQHLGLLVGVVAALFAVVPHMILGDAAIPASDFVRDLTIMLAVVISVGILTGLVAIRVTLNTPLVPALRGE